MSISVNFKVSAHQNFDLQVAKEDTPKVIADRIRAETGAVVSESDVAKLVTDVFDHGKTSFDFAATFPGSKPLLVPPKDLQPRAVSDRSALLSGAATSAHPKDLQTLATESALLDPVSAQPKRVATEGPPWLAADAVSRFPLVTKQGLLDIIKDLVVRLFTGEKTQFTSGLSQAQRDAVFSASRQLIAEHPDRAFAVAMLPRADLEAAVKTQLATSQPGLSAKEADKLTKYAVNGMLSAIPRAEFDRTGPKLTLTLADGTKLETSKRLGSGANGAVFSIDLPDGKKAVIKVPANYDLYLRDAADLSEAHDQSSREIEAHHHVASLAPNASVIDFLGVAQTPEGVPLLICEYVKGKNGAEVSEALDALDLNMTDKHDVARYMGRQMCEGLAHAHDNRHVLHLDVKPENFMLADEDLRFKLADFGEGELGDSMRLKYATGSPVFMSPEIYKKQGSTAADVWSMGVTLYKAISGRYPIIDDAKTSEFSRRLADFTSDPKNRVIGASDLRFSDDARDLINRMMHPDASQRPKMSEILQHPFFAPSAESDKRAREILQRVVPNTVK